MKLSLQERLLGREIGERRRYGDIKGLYGDGYFVDKLDIVNELQGHTGCVNALSWSRSGELLASGSDDTKVNIYSYMPENSTSQFSLKTTLHTDHSANIFSVKFMPHSNDRTMVTCAGDSQVRIFDLERSARSPIGTNLTGATSNVKVFRSHKGSVKRIVTEASPFYFLTCSEDGEVRQWDIRQPESYYCSHRRAHTPPLISYGKYGINLFTLSCSPSQPHYIALGGSHLHCFLHDRRMLGRDKRNERGQTWSSQSGSAFDDTVSDATRCVAKFAPYGQPKMTRNENRYITACKLGRENPNELIVSWSIDLIYSFNILKDQQNAVLNKFNTPTEQLNPSSSRKRKRVITGESPSAGPNPRRRVMNMEDDESPSQELGLFMTLSNGERLELPIFRDLPFSFRSSRDEDESGDTELSNAQRVRNMKNCLKKSHFDHSPNKQFEELTNILKSSSTAFEAIDDYIIGRTYPVTDSSSVVDYQLKLRNDRAKVWRYTQASGTIARVLLQVGFPDRRLDSELRQTLGFFESVRPAPREGSTPLERHEHFGYDFIKAVLLWLDSGVGAVLREFSPDSDSAAAGSRRRFPVSKNASVDAIEKQLIPYLEGLATDLPVVYAGHGGAGDDPRQTDTLFRSEKEAVRDLAREMKKTWSDLNGVDEQNEEADVSGMRRTERRREALKFWGWKVCFAVLENAAIDVNFPFVETAFGEAKETRRRNASNETPANFERTENDDINNNDNEDDFSNYESSPDDEDDEDSKLAAEKDVPCTSHIRQYTGHCNCETAIKDVNFYGLHDEYIVSGSDGGHFFIWEKKSGRLVNILAGDLEVVNVVQPHPYEPMLAVSGIDSTVKIFSPDSKARRDATLALNGVSAADSSTFPTIGLRQSDDESDGNSDDGSESGDTDDSDEGEREPLAENGLKSRKMMGREYQITNRNDMTRRSELQQHNIRNQGVYQLLAAQLAAQLNGRGVDGAEDENCNVM